MDLNEAVTVTKVFIDGERNYLLVGWHPNSFELYIYTLDGTLWKGRFSTNRMNGFSKNLHMSRDEYFEKVKRCLSQSNDDYTYELKSGFFYWKRKINDTVILEGFLPVEEIITNKSSHPDLIEILIALNKDLKEKVTNMCSQFSLMKDDFQRCLRDTEEFLNLKVEMEKSLCEKFLNLIHAKKENLESENLKKIDLKDDVKFLKMERSKLK